VTQPFPITVSFVVPTRNRARSLEKTLRSILAQDAGASAEILVVDNGSTDGTEAVVRRVASESPVELRFFSMSENRGPAASRNYGSRLARGDYIAFVDSDVQLRGDWLRHMLELFRSRPGAGIAAGKVVFASAPDVIHCFGGQLSRIGLGWDGGQEEDARGCAGVFPRLWAPSASIMARRQPFLDAGGFDENYFFGYEDSDLGWRFNIEGWDCLCVGHAVSFHSTSAHIDDAVVKISPDIVFHYSKNRIRSMVKNYELRSLCLYLPFALGYSVCDALLRSPRRSRLRALLWNLVHLPETLALRREIQRSRRRSDSELWHLFADRWFPELPLPARLKRMQQYQQPDGLWKRSTQQ